MKIPLPVFALLFSIQLSAQINSPAIKANFGVDGELRAYLFNGFTQPSDDWFIQGAENNSSKFVIDTTGAASMIARYTADPNFRKLPFFRTMRYRSYSFIGPTGSERIWIDGIYIRDYNSISPGDSTAFILSNKNGDSPADWTGGVTLLPDKTDIADMMVHVRRDGKYFDSPLWFFGGVAIQNANGNRYFDFELYQTDIFYSRSTGKFTGFGPDAGHTSWKFDASGNILSTGDVVFSANYQSSGLSSIEARIWIDKASMSIVPTAFDWGGSFDGANASSQFGYASIKPKGTLDYYMGLQSNNNTWAGPYGHIDGGNNLLSTYAASEYMEFAVNLTYLGLDPITFLSGGACGLPFRRILVKTRSATSFTASLKDFIGPFDFFTAPPVKASADVPLFCGVTGVSTLSVKNPASASVYNWYTPNGHIFGTTTGPSILVDSPGTYIVQQQLLDGCATSSSDTVTILYDKYCVPMDAKVITLKGDLKDKTVLLQWTTKANLTTDFFELQRSEDGKTFTTVSKLKVASENSEEHYQYRDNLAGLNTTAAYYRLKIWSTSGGVIYSPIVRLAIPVSETDIALYPNPASSNIQLTVPSGRRQDAEVKVYNAAGGFMFARKYELREGSNALSVELPGTMATGAYLVNVVSGTINTWKRFTVAKENTRY